MTGRRRRQRVRRPHRRPQAPWGQRRRCQWLRAPSPVLAVGRRPSVTVSTRQSLSLGYQPVDKSIVA